MAAGDRSDKFVGNLFSDIPANLDEELFETLLKQNGCRLERIVSRGHSTPEGQWYDQAWDEWVLLLKGKAALQTEGQDALHELYPGDHILLVAHQRHRVAWTDPDGDTVWLALHLENALPK